MKICNNCGSENNSAAHQCLHCHMSGDFRPVHEPAVQLRAAIDTRMCINCGEDDAGKEAVCQHCQFPLPSATKAADHNLTTKAG